MGKLADDTVIDGALNIIKNNCTTMLVCALEPTDRADALSKALADVAMTGTDFTVANGDTNGRKITVAAKSGVPVDTSGTADHIALISASVLLFVTTCTSKVITSGDAVNIPTWKDEIADPT
jgi:hypothetical protein